MIDQCTKEMLKIMKVDASDKPDIYNDLYSWHVKPMKVGRKNLVYLMNDASKLSIIFYGLTAKDFKGFDALVQEGIKQVLEDLGVDRSIIEQYLSHSGTALFTTTGTRKQIAVLNRAAMDIEFFFSDLSDLKLLQRDMCNQQNSSIVKNDKGNYITPKVVMKNKLDKFFGRHKVQFDLVEIGLQMYHDDLNLMSYLNMHDGKICVEKRDTEKCEALKQTMIMF